MLDARTGDDRRPRGDGEKREPGRRMDDRIRTAGAAVSLTALGLPPIFLIIAGYAGRTKLSGLEPETNGLKVMGEASLQPSAK